MDGSGGGDEGGHGAERSTAGVGSGRGDMRPPGWHWVTERGAFHGDGGPIALRSSKWGSYGYHVAVHPTCHGCAHGARSPHARPSHQKVQFKPPYSLPWNSKVA